MKTFYHFGGRVTLTQMSEKVIKFNGLSWTADSEVHVIHIAV